ncbi:alpha/beta hydrolase [Kibdelosporangium philippinense]|uniref:Alpha/beta hydrolase n=1 Tax=Kibdelosporangium philippinense TaxID=211113 RepID=A0ABS8Z8J1_9PSEU|nr:alpha/beta hydrolase [Kibdelosporangium philippinense]MCE7003399.1 alpha/beta hydrolase [Kibdelosporangium philippinense]
MTILELPDGRVLDVLVSGPEDGIPLVFNHGTPSAVVPLSYVKRNVHERGLRLVTFSRAGYGKSTRQLGRDVAAAAPDVAAILDHLEAPRCVVAGWSGGGPHALACAALLPDRVTGALIVAGIAPAGQPDLDFLAGMGEPNIEEFSLAEKGEAVLRPALEEAAPSMAANDPDMIAAGFAGLLSAPDEAALTGELVNDIAANFAEALGSSVDGWLDDDLAFVKPWGFELASITVPTFVYQGSEDLMVPFAHGQWLVANVPNAVAHLETGDGHLSIMDKAFTTGIDELVKTL